MGGPVRFPLLSTPSPPGKNPPPPLEPTLGPLPWLGNSESHPPKESQVVARTVYDDVRASTVDVRSFCAHARIAQPSGRPSPPPKLKTASEYTPREY